MIFFSEWGLVPSGVPQDTKLSPWLFLLMINDLHSSEAQAWKYVDDTTLAEVVPTPGNSSIQCSLTEVEQWSIRNKLHLNADKCKELIIDLKKSKHGFNPISVNSKELELVNHAKILGVTIGSTLQWNNHIHEVIRKANKRIYFLILLKRARVPINDIDSFYSTCIRPVLRYCASVFHHALPAYLSDELQSVYKSELRQSSFQMTCLIMKDFLCVI